MDSYRVFVEKRPEFATEATALLHDLNETLHLSLTGVRVINVYDLFNISASELDTAVSQVLSELVTDKVHTALPVSGSAGDAHRVVIATEYLPGQYDQRADSAMQAISLLCGNNNAIVKSGKVFILESNNGLAANDIDRIKNYLINPVESREKDLTAPLALPPSIQPDPVPVFAGFRALSSPQLSEFLAQHGMAMSLADIELIQKYFGEQERRDPTETELRVLDTYWSDHCRHTTFETVITDVKIPPGHFQDALQKAFDEYLTTRARVYGERDRPITLMDLATLAAKDQRQRGLLSDQEISNEINACSIYVDVDVDGVSEPWLLMFKNETHNHPTEIEPYGGASTCIGGAIRDPLSGRSYVYQAMRLSGVADINEPIEETLPGKLPQKAIAKGAAHGNSSYGNQIGLATSYVKEIFHPGYQAKHLEVGAVVGAVPAKDVLRLEPEPGDVILLLGGATGRDGIGGATGSSKVHTEQSVTEASSEVQKGNAPMERKIQRLFRNPDVTKLIKKCNDFGAGGVCVAIGELADGLVIDLDAVPTKYDGLTGTELAISESQERMAVVVAPADVARFQQLAASENLDAVVVARVTDDHRLTMHWAGGTENGDPTIVSLSRDFLATNGADQQASVVLKTDFPMSLPPSPLASVVEPVETTNAELGYPVVAPVQTTSRSDQGSVAAWLTAQPSGDTWVDKFLTNLRQPNVASRQGMVEMFDSTVGAGTVLMPYGGKYQLTESEGSVHKLPVRHGETDTVSILTYGFDPFLTSWSPFHGAAYAVIESIAKVVAIGGDWQGIRFSFQEYFQRLGTDPAVWGEPFAALLGAFTVQQEFGLPAIGGKDSMSGSFHELHVPPTFISFAVQTGKATNIISPAFKAPDDYIYLVTAPLDENLLPSFDKLKQNFTYIHDAVLAGKLTAAATVKSGGIAETIAKMSFGNNIGASIIALPDVNMFAPLIGAVIITSPQPLDYPDAQLLGRTTAEPVIQRHCGLDPQSHPSQSVTIADAITAWQAPYDQTYPRIATPPAETSLASVIPLQAGTTTNIKRVVEADGTSGLETTHQRVLPTTIKPKVLLPVFPGTNCEYDSARALEKAGADTHIEVFRNRDSRDVANSIKALASQIATSQILMLSGGFSAGDEPDGSGKFIAAVLQNDEVRASVEDLLTRGGLILGICNGFQALVKVGLLPYGQFGQVTTESPTLVKNDINRHISKIVQTRIAANTSPWLAGTQVGDLHQLVLSHGEGKFVVQPPMLAELYANGQVATQYVDPDGQPTMDPRFNPNGSVAAIEGITSPDGRIFGKMGHSERIGPNLHKNVVGNYDQMLFRSGVAYFRQGG